MSLHFFRRKSPVTLFVPIKIVISVSMRGIEARACFALPSSSHHKRTFGHPSRDHAEFRRPPPPPPQNKKSIFADLVGKLPGHLPADEEAAGARVLVRGGGTGNGRFHRRKPASGVARSVSSQSAS